MAGIGTTIKKIFGVLLIVVGSILVLLGLFYAIGVSILDKHFSFWNIPISLIMIVPGLWLGLKGINLLGDSGATYGARYHQVSSGTSFDYNASRANDPHTCGNCTKYSSTRGECRLGSGKPTTAEDTCSNWC